MVECSINSKERRVNAVCVKEGVQVIILFNDGSYTPGDNVIPECLYEYSLIPFYLSM